MAKANPKLLSPEDVRSYQLELIDLIMRRNESLSKGAARQHFETRQELRQKLGDESGWNPQGWQEQVEREFYLAGGELVSVLLREVSK